MHQGHSLNDSRSVTLDMANNVKANKHDAADAGSICGAVGRPSMHFVPVSAVSS